MGLIFSKTRNQAIVAPEPYPIQMPNHHAHHPSTVSYDFNTSKGQIRALRAIQEIDEKKESKPKKRKVKIGFR